jgi:hypothetical protein
MKDTNFPSCWVNQANRQLFQSFQDFQVHLSDIRQQHYGKQLDHPQQCVGPIIQGHQIQSDIKRNVDLNWKSKTEL